MKPDVIRDDAADADRESPSSFQGVLGEIGEAAELRNRSCPQRAEARTVAAAKHSRKTGEISRDVLDDLH